MIAAAVAVDNDDTRWHGGDDLLRRHGVLQQTTDVVGAGEIDGALTLLVLEEGICPVGQQQGAQLRSPLLRRLVEGREAPFVSGIDHGVVLDEQSRDVQVTVARGVVQGYEATLVLCIHVGPALQQKFGNVQVVVASYNSGGEESFNYYYCHY